MIAIFLCSSFTQSSLPKKSNGCSIFWSGPLALSVSALSVNTIFFKMGINYVMILKFFLHKSCRHLFLYFFFCDKPWLLKIEMVAIFDVQEVTTSVVIIMITSSVALFLFYLFFSLVDPHFCEGFWTALKFQNMSRILRLTGNIFFCVSLLSVWDKTLL